MLSLNFSEFYHTCISICRPCLEDLVKIIIHLTTKVVYETLCFGFTEICVHNVPCYNSEIVTNERQTVH